MVFLIILNIILIILLSFLVLYIFRKDILKNKDDNKSVYIDDKKCLCVHNEIDKEINNNEIDKEINDEVVYIKNKINENKQKRKRKNTNSKKVFIGRFVTDEEYNEMIKNKKSTISILREEFKREYEHFKELNK
jgi:hypothetical protein